MEIASDLIAPKIIPPWKITSDANRSPDKPPVVVASFSPIIKNTLRYPNLDKITKQLVFRYS